MYLRDLNISAVSIFLCFFLHFRALFVTLVNIIFVTFLLISLLAISPLIAATFLSAVITLHVVLCFVWTSKQCSVDAECKVSDEHFIEQFRK